MNIKSIQINNLFHTFNHNILLNKDIKIIMGENGVGKTVSLKLIDAIFNKNYEFLAETDFQSIAINFGREKWKITKEKSIDNDYIDKICISSNKKGTEPFIIDSSMIYPRLPSYVDKIDDDHWINRRNRVIYSREHLADRYPPLPLNSIPEWMQNQLNNNHVKLINTQRLFFTENNREAKNGLAVDIYSDELKTLMQEEMTKASLTTADLDRTFPKRLVNLLKAHKKFKLDDILQEIKDLEKKRGELSEAGLLTTKESETIDADDLDEKDKTMLAVMYQYIKDSKEKLHKYDKLYNKVSLLCQIIDTHFKRKALKVDSYRGFIVYPKIDEKIIESDIIPLRNLSSGEQNELVLFYELLFKCDDKDLILIDEPEISLHLEWLQSMIDDIKSIVNENGSKLLIATHSPDFVGDNYDLVQNLK